MNEAKNYKLLLIPSWISSLVVTIIAVTIITYVSLSAYFKHNLHQLIPALNILSSQASVNYYNITAGLSNIAVINELPIYFFWAAIGFIVYIMAIKTYKAFTNITEMEQEFKYVHADKRAILKEELTHVGIRLLAVVLFILSYFIFIRYVLPYSLLQAYSLGLNLSFSSIWHSIWATLLLFISFHLVVIELRLLFMRSRIIGK